MEGKLTLAFRIYAGQEAEKPAWEETQEVTLLGGVFNVLLPADPGVAPFPEDLFADGTTRWLAIAPEAQDELPRTPVVSVAYALHAARAQTAALAATANGLTCLGCVGQDHLAASLLVAENVVYDNQQSGLASTNLQDGLDELFAEQVGHNSQADAHHSSTSDGLHITPASVAIKDTSTKLTDGTLDLGPEAKDQLTSAHVQTLTGGEESNADALHSHAGGGGGGVCYTAWGLNTCLDGFEVAYTGTAVYPIVSYGGSGAGGTICAQGLTKNTSFNYGYWHFGAYKDAYNGYINCAVCCK